MCQLRIFKFLFISLILLLFTTVPSWGYKKTPIQSSGFPTVPSESGDYENTRLLIFISSSIPEDIIRQYIADTDTIKDQVVFVLRGFVKTPDDFKPTIKYIKKILCKDPDDKNSCKARTIDINPELFRLFNITQVPAFVVLEEKLPDGCLNLDEPPLFYLSYGDAVLAYHLSRASKAGSKEAERLLRSLKKSFYD